MSSEVKITKEVVTKNFAEVIVNGESKGKREINGGPSVLHLATELAREYGIRSFNVTFTDAEGTRTPIQSTEQGRSTPVSAGSTVAVQAKDARGFAKAKAEGAAEMSTEGADPGNKAEPVTEPEAADGNKAEEATQAEPTTESEKAAEPSA